MKKSIKRVLSVFLTCLMLMTCWVWVAPAEVNASSDSVYSGAIHVTVLESQNIIGHVKMYYYPYDKEVGFDTNNTAELIVVNSWNGDGYSTEGMYYEIPFSCSGYPYQFDVYVDGSGSGSKGEVRVHGISINGTYTDFCGGYNVAKGQTVTFNDAGDNTGGPYDTWKEPYVASGTSGNLGELGSVTVPKPGDSLAVSSDFIEAQWYDQYGYEWPCAPSYSISNMELCTLKNYGDKAYIQVTNSNLSKLIPENGYSAEAGYADVTVTVKPYEGYTGECTANGYYRIYSPTLTVNFYDENGITKLGSGTCYYSGSVDVPSATKEPDSNYFYPFSEWVDVDNKNQVIESSFFSSVTKDLNVQAVYKKTSTPVYETTLNFEVTNSPEGGGYIKVYYHKFKEDGSGVDTSTSYVADFVSSLTNAEEKKYAVTKLLDGIPYKVELRVNWKAATQGTVKLDSVFVGEKNVLGTSDGFTNNVNAVSSSKTMTWQMNFDTGAPSGDWGSATPDWPAPAITTIEADPIELKSNDFGGSTVSKKVEFTLKDQYGVVWGIAPEGSHYISNDKNGADTNGLSTDNIFCTESTPNGLPYTTVYAKPEVQLLNENKTTGKFYLQASFGSAKCTVPIYIINSSYMKGVASESNELVKRIDSELLNADIDLVLEALLEKDYDHESITLDTWKYDYEYKNADGTTTKVKKGEAVTTVREWIISSVINSVFSGSIPQFMLEKVHSRTGYEMYTLDGDLVSGILNDSFVYFPRTTRETLVTMPHQFATNWTDPITGEKPVAVTGIEELRWYKFFNGELYGNSDKYDYTDILRVWSKAPLDTSINNSEQARSYWYSFRYPDKMKDQGFSQYADNNPMQGLNPGYFDGTHPLYWYKLDSAGNVIDYREESAYILSGQGTSYNFEKMSDGETDYGYLPAEQVYDFAKAEADGYIPYYYSSKEAWGIESFSDFYHAMNSAFGGHQVLLSTLLSGYPSKAERKLADLDLTLKSDVSMYYSIFMNLYSILGIDAYNEASNPHGYRKLTDIEKLCRTDLDAIDNNCVGFVAENNYGVELWKALLEPIVHWIENELFVRPVESVLTILPGILLEAQENRILSDIIKGANVDVFLSLVSAKIANIDYSDFVFTGELAKLGIGPEAAEGGINGILKGLFGLARSETVFNENFALKKQQLSDEIYEDENGYQYEGINLDYQYEGIYRERNRISDPGLIAQKLFDKIGQPYLDWLSWTDNKGTIGFDVPTELYSSFIEIVQWLFDEADGFNKIKPLLEGRISKLTGLEEYGVKETAETKVISKWLTFTDYSSVDYLAHVKRVLDNLKKLSPSGHANEDGDIYCDVCGREVILSGECGAEGDNLTWTLNLITGVFEISGTGDMANYGIAEDEGIVPWLYLYFDCRRYIKSVIVNEGVTCIGNDAFLGCHNLTSVSLPDTLLRIGRNAFSSCYSLQNLKIPESVETVGDTAFYHCYNITEVNIGKNMISIGDCAFGWCTNLTRFSVDEDNMFFSTDENGVLFNKNKTTLISYPANRNSKTYTIPDTVTKIADYGMYLAYKLEYLYLPNSINDIGFEALSACINLKDLSLPSGLTSIGSYALDFSYALKNVYVSGYNTILNRTSVCLTDRILTMPLEEYVVLELKKAEHFKNGEYKSAFSIDDVQSENVIILDTPVPTGTIYSFTGSTAEAYANENNIDFVTIGNPNYKVTLDFDVTNAIEGGGHIKIYYHPFKADGSGIDTSLTKEMVFINSLSSSYSEIGSYAATGEIPGWPCKIEIYLLSEFATKSEIRINSFEIGAVTVFGGNDTYTIQSSLGSGITTIFEVDPISGEIGETLSGANVNWPIPAITQVYTNGANQISVGKFGEGSKSYEYHFNAIDQYGVNWPIMPRGTYNIVDANDDTAIFNSSNIICDSTSSAGLPVVTVNVNPEAQLLAPGKSSATYYIKSVFNGVVTKAPITLENPEYVVAFDANGGTFDESELATLNLVYGQKINHIPSGGKKEGKQLLGFVSNVQLTDSEVLKDPSPTNTKYKWLKASTYIDENATDSIWYAVWGLKDVNVTFRMPDGSTIAKITGKYNNSMINSASGKEMYLDMSALNKAVKLRNRNNNVTFNNQYEPVYIGDGANYKFAGWKLVEMYDLDGNALAIESELTAETAVLKGDAVFEAVFEVAEIDSGYCGAEENGQNLTWTVDVTNGILTISGSGDMRNYYVSKLAPWHGYRNYIKTVIVESGVTSIGDFAFYELRKAEEVTLADGITVIGKSAFNGCDSITEITVPESVEEIKTKAFQSCDSLENFIVADGNTSFAAVDGVLFSADLTSIIKYPDGKTDAEYVFPETVTKIAEHAFSESENLVSVEISDGVEIIDNSAFYGCKNLESIVLGDTVKAVNPYAFYGCSNLSEVTLSASIETIGDWAFYNCTNLVQVNYTGTEEDWAAYGLDRDNNNIATASVNCCYVIESPAEPAAVMMFMMRRPVVDAECEHSFESVVTEATCLEIGYTTYICECGYSYVDSYVDIAEHKYENGDECVNCGYNRTSDCNCKCHEESIIGVIYRIILFLQKLFGKNVDCVCGAAHN